MYKRQGLGAGADPNIGRDAAHEDRETIRQALDGADMVFITAGMGGGTGTGAAPEVAKIAREMGILTVAVVTKPFPFEGKKRTTFAEQGIVELANNVDSLITIPNEKLLKVMGPGTPLLQAFSAANDVLRGAVQGIAELITRPGLINVDFADVRTVMSEMGKAMMGTGEASGERRAMEAAEAAINNPLLDDSSMQGAKGVLINITGGMDITLFEVDEAANRIRDEVDSDAHIIIGSAFDKELDGLMRVSVVATGIDAAAAEQPRPQVLTVSETPAVRQIRPEAPKAPVAEEAPLRRVPAAQTAATADVKPAAAAMADTPKAETTEIDTDSKEVADVKSAFSIQDTPRPTAAAEQPEAKDAAGVAEEKAEDTSVDDVLPAIDETPKVAAAAADVTAEAPKAEEKAEEPVAATPNIGATDAFIPKPAAGAEDASKAITENSDPMAEAALINGGREPEERKAPAKAKTKSSLFELVTGTGKAAIDRVTGNQRVDAVAAPTVDRGEPKAERTIMPSGGGRAAIGQAASQLAPQPTLGGLEPEDRIQEAQDDEDDLLDIPAFLRRQAN